MVSYLKTSSGIPTPQFFSFSSKTYLASSSVSHVIWFLGSSVPWLYPLAA